jgi:hypothetical protein
MTYIPNFIKTGFGIQKLIGRDVQTAWRSHKPTSRKGSLKRACSFMSSWATHSLWGGCSSRKLIYYLVSKLLSLWEYCKNVALMLPSFSSQNFTSCVIMFASLTTVSKLPEVAIWGSYSRTWQVVLTEVNTQFWIKVSVSGARWPSCVSCMQLYRSYSGPDSGHPERLWNSLRSFTNTYGSHWCQGGVQVLLQSPRMRFESSFSVFSLNYMSKLMSPSWEAANCAATQELFSILRNPKVHDHVHKSSPLGPYPELGRSNPYHPILSL